MSASPSLPSVDGSKWKKRRRDTEIVVKRSTEEDDEEDEEDEDSDAEDDEDRVISSQCPLSDPLVSTTRETEVLSEGGVRISDFPIAIRHNVNRPHSSVLAIVELERSLHRGDAKNLASPIFLENVSYGQLLAVSSVTVNSSSVSNQDNADGGTSAYVIAPQIHSRYGILKRFMNFHNHIVPMHADWFSSTGVHRLERQVVPHFFSGKSSVHTPEKYVQCRNSIISMYLENPEKRLSITDSQKSSDDTGVEDLTRIFRFLDSWGVINYCSTPDFEPCSSMSHLREDVNGDLLVLSNALKSIDSLIRFDIPKCRLMSPNGHISGTRSNNGASDLDNRIRERLSDYHCYFCSRPAPVVHYQSQKQADVLLCTDCFHDGKFVVGHSSIDFLRVDLPNEFADTDSESWTDQETLLLLEAVEKYNDNWNEIAEHVSTKSKSQCILHFIGLPMGGRLENIEIPVIPGLGHSSSTLISDAQHLHSNGGSSGLSVQFPESEYRIPFANSKNPVMSLVAFLASALGPRVAAACAHALLTVLSGGDKPDEGDVTPLPGERVESAVRAGVGAAAIKAKLFAEHEEREIQRLSANIINQQLKKLELKLRQFAEVEMMLMKECEQVERARQRFAAERARIVSTRSGPSGISPTLAAVGPNIVNSGPAGSQPMLSSFGVQQPIQHTQSRPLLAAPAAANFVFNASGNPQQAHSSS